MRFIVGSYELRRHSLAPVEVRWTTISFASHVRLPSSLCRNPACAELGAHPAPSTATTKVRNSKAFHYFRSSPGSVGNSEIPWQHAFIDTAVRLSCRTTIVVCSELLDAGMQTVLQGPMTTIEGNDSDARRFST